jgi:hypothetical protein
MHLAGMHLAGLHIAGMHLAGLHIAGMHLAGLHLAGLPIAGLHVCLLCCQLAMLYGQLGSGLVRFGPWFLLGLCLVMIL